MKNCNECELRSKCLTKIKLVILLINDTDINKKKTVADTTVSQYAGGLANWCSRFIEDKQVTSKIKYKK